MSFRRSQRQRSAVARTGLDPLDGLFLLALATFVMTSWFAFTLAEFGVDRPLIVGGIGSIALAIGVIRIAGRFPWQALRWPDLAILSPLILGTALFFPPDEWILGGLDPGGYVNAGAAIARSGSIVQSDATLAALPPAVRDALFPLPASQVPGFYLMSLKFQGIIPTGFVSDVNRIIPHGFHLFPTVLAFGYALGGIRSELAVTPVLAVSALVGFYLLWRRIFGNLVAVIASSFLAVSPAEVWFARYPAAEILVQLLLFGGLLAFAVTVATGSRWTAALAGLALGEIHLAKIEMITIPLVLGAFFGWLVLSQSFHRHWLWLIGCYVALLSQALLHAVIIAGWYSEETVRVSLSPSSLRLLAAASLLILVAFAILAGSPNLRQAIRRAGQNPRWHSVLNLVVPLVIGGLALYGYYLRPLGSTSVPIASLDSAQLSELNNLQSFVRLGWYIAPIGVLLGTLGSIVLVRRAIDRRFIVFFALVALDCALFFPDMRITPLHYWAARRWIPLVIPGFLLAAAYFLGDFLPRRVKGRLELAVPLGFAIVMTLGLLGATRPLLGYVEYRGAIDQVQALAAMVPRDSVVLFAPDDAGIRLATPFEYLYQRSSIILPGNNVVPVVASQIKQWQAQGRMVYWIASAPLTSPSGVEVAERVVGQQVINLPEKLATVDTRPGVDGLFRVSLTIWELDP